MQEVADILMQVLKEKNKNTPTHTHIKSQELQS